MHVLGLMSGTSADGVDAVLVDFKGRLHKPSWKILNYCSVNYPLELRSKIIDVIQNSKLNNFEWLDLAESITKINYEAALKCDPYSKADVIGCHGQTVFHRPPSNNKLGASLQLIRAPLLAEMINKPVIYDFRAADMVLGGQGAPLVPLTDEVLIGRGEGWRGILNLGGIANLTLLPPLHGPESSCKVLGWDCGPANSLIDLAIQKISKGKLFFDKDSLIAKKGNPNESLIRKWLQEPFFQLIPPKSTGREQFGLSDLKLRLSDMLHLSTNDQISTLTAFTAALVAQDLNNLYSRSFIRPIELLVAGGGSRNPFIFEQLIKRCNGIRVSTLDELHIPVLAREALAFALLAWWNVHEFKGSSPFVTGATKPTVLGVKVKPASY